MTRRRSDRVRPYAEIPRDDLTEAQRQEVQDVIAEQYLGRKDRDAWDRTYWRGGSGTSWVRARQTRIPSGSSRGSAEWQR